MNLSNNVIIKGSITDESKINLLQSSILYLQPTLSEGFGVAILEAQSCGLPVITTFEPCINEIFSETVIQASNIEDLSIKMDEIIKNPALYNKYVKLGFQNSHKYSFERRKKELKLIIDSIL